MQWQGRPVEECCWYIKLYSVRDIRWTQCIEGLCNNCSVACLVSGIAHWVHTDTDSISVYSCCHHDFLLHIRNCYHCSPFHGDKTVLEVPCESFFCFPSYAWMQRAMLNWKYVYITKFCLCPSQLQYLIATLSQQWLQLGRSNHQLVWTRPHEFRTRCDKINKAVGGHLRQDRVLRIPCSVCEISLHQLDLYQPAWWLGRAIKPLPTNSMTHKQPHHLMPCLNVLLGNVFKVQ